MSDNIAEPSEKEALKIRQLLKHAEGTEYEEERDAYISRAQRLASRYSIDMELILSHAEGAKREELERRNHPAKRYHEMGSKGDRGAGVYSELFAAIGRPNDVKCWRSNAHVEAFGMSIDLDYVESLFALLLPQMVGECEDYLDQGEWRGTGVTKNEARKSFCAGFIERVEVRLRNARDEAIAEANQADSGTALVVKDKRRKVDNFYYGAVRSRRNHSRRIVVRSGAARKAGNISGSNASFTGSKGNLGR